MTIENLAAASPREIDEALWALAQEAAEVGQAQAVAVRSVFFAAGAREVTEGRGRSKVTYWTLNGERATFAAAMGAAKVVAAGDDYYKAPAAQRAIAKHDAALAELARIDAEAAPLNAQWQERQWSRFFLVTSSAGHIHSSMECSTCQWSTQFAWLPSVSGKTEAEAVAEHGARLCSVCFPTAPTEWQEGYFAAKVAAECPGSRTHDFDTATARMGYYSGNYGVCNHCQQRITLTSANRLRGHKPA